MSNHDCTPKTNIIVYVNFKRKLLKVKKFQDKKEPMKSQFGEKLIYEKIIRRRI